MKILVVSLLRLGDFIQALPVVGGLHRKFPQAKIDVLVHSPVAALRPMIPAVSRWFTLDRDELQSGLGRADIPLLTSFDVLREQCEALSTEKYDLIVNVTQTEFSAWIMGYIAAKTKIGLCFNVRGQASFNSPWFRYLNDHTETSVSDVLNYSDIFSYACDVSEEPRQWPMTVTSQGAGEVAALKLPAGEVIAVQALTSDAKKNWGAARWSQWLSGMTVLRPQAHFVLLGSSAEKTSLEELVNGISEPQRISLGILSLEGALVLLNRATLLVTGDTSIKHMANAASCAVMELSLGSSDYRRTGIYKENSLILQGKAACAPCPHSSPCSQASHICAEKIPVGAAISAADLFLKSDWNGLGQIARSFNLDVLRTRVMSTGFWFAGEIVPADAVKIVDKWIERSAWKFLLSGAAPNPLPKFGSEVYQLGDEITLLIPTEGIRPLLAHLDFLEEQLSRREVEATAARRRFDPSTPAGELVDLSGLRAVQNRLEDERRQIEVKSKLVRSLKTKLVEKT